MHLIHLKHKDIDKKKWDAAVCSGCNLPYMLSWWLDIVCPQWEAVIADDYKMLFPLPIKKIGPFKLVEQPMMTQQLGLIAADGHTPTTEETEAFIRNIPYRSYIICLNENNNATTHVDQTRLNLKLSLCASYEETSSRFNNNTKRNIRKASEYGLELTETSADEFLDFYIENNLHNTTNRDPLNKILAASQENNSSIIISAKRNGTIVSAVMLLGFKNRLVYLLPASSKDGKDCRAMFHIINNIIKEHCNSDTELDFEGSMEESVAKFYKGFGASEFHYCKISRLPLLYYLRKTLCRIRGRK